MEKLADYAELLLLIFLSVMQLGRWAQKQEDTPESLAKEVKEVRLDLGRFKHEVRTEYMRKDLCTVEQERKSDKFDRIEDRLKELEDNR